ncbi:MAG: hypothetical protein K0Q55_1233 [Verrucomicrobia bacterium]|jgi:hypothetical protein|nr:hypothetical protein [Verrucomicrobiota bacterium]
MKPFLTFLCLLATAVGLVAAEPARPKLTVADDGYPAGRKTPEGVACDLARAFIQRDAALFTNTCVRLYAGGNGPVAYAEFLQTTAASIQQEATRKEARGPKSIGKVFAARHLSRNGPASYGYAAFSFQEIMFVDVGVLLHNGKAALNRTMVIRDKDGLWYVHPAPQVSPLLSAGLNDEPASQTDFSAAYEVVYPNLAVTGAVITEVGIYTARPVETQAAPGVAGGNRGVLDSFTLVQTTTNIPARKGIRFGFRYTIQGTPTNASILLKTVGEHPPLKDPRTGKTQTRYEYEHQSRIASSYTAYSMDEEWELVAGSWKFSVWSGDKKLCEQAFQVVPDTKAKE